jgi:hypothetical protein
MKTTKDLQHLPNGRMIALMIFAVAALCLLSYTDPADHNISGNINEQALTSAFSPERTLMLDYTSQDLNKVDKVDGLPEGSGDIRVRTLSLEYTPEETMAYEPWMTDQTTWFCTDDTNPVEELTYEPWMTDQTTWFCNDDTNPVEEPAYQAWMTDNTTWHQSSDFMMQKSGTAFKNGMLNQFLY